jgi:hypothetical protein
MNAKISLMVKMKAHQEEHEQGMQITFSFPSLHPLL